MRFECKLWSEKSRCCLLVSSTLQRRSFLVLPVDGPRWEDFRSKRFNLIKAINVLSCADATHCDQSVINVYDPALDRIYYLIVPIVFWGFHVAGRHQRIRLFSLTNECHGWNRKRERRQSKRSPRSALDLEIRWLIFSALENLPWNCVFWVASSRRVCVALL